MSAALSMRTVLTALAISAILLTAFSQVHAAPSNGTRFPEFKQVELGYEYVNLFARPLARGYGDIKTQNNFYTVSFGVTDWFVLDGQIGLGDVTLCDSTKLPRLDFDVGFAGGYGLRVQYFKYDPFGLRFIAGFQHISVHPQDESARDDKYECFLDDWQVSSLVAKDIGPVTLYAGIKGSDLEFVYKLNKQDKKRRWSERHVGLITGLEAYLFGRKLRLGAEGRFIDETALSASASWLF